MEINQVDLYQAFMQGCPSLKGLPMVGGFTGGSLHTADGHEFRRGRGYAMILDPSPEKVLQAAMILGREVYDQLVGRSVPESGGYSDALKMSARDEDGIGWSAFGFHGPEHGRTSDHFRFLGPGVPHMVLDDGLGKGLLRYEDGRMLARVRVWGQLITRPAKSSRPLAKLSLSEKVETVRSFMKIKGYPVPAWMRDDVVAIGSAIIKAGEPADKLCTCDMMTVLMRSGCKCGGR